MLLEAAGVKYQRCDQPIVLPRKDLEELGITYRRIPVLAVGKDVYCDSGLIFDIVLDKLAKKQLPTSPADKAWEAWGLETFKAALPLIPHELVTPDFVKDRETIFPMLKRPDFKTLRPSAVADLQSRLSFLENDVLASNPFIGGDKLSVADIHVIWSIRWALEDLGAKQEKQLSKDAFPKVWKLIEGLPLPKPEELSSENTIKAIKAAALWSKDKPVMSDDPLNISVGTPITIESAEYVTSTSIVVPWR